MIGIEDDWELLVPSGERLDGHQDPTEREAYRFHAMLGADVVSFEVAAPDSYALRFYTGHRLRLFDRSSQYESFSIQPGDVYV